MSALFFTPEEYLRFFPSYYANPQLYNFDLKAMTGQEPSSRELSVTRRVHYTRPTPAPRAKSSAGFAMSLGIGLVGLVVLLMARRK